MLPTSRWPTCRRFDGRTLIALDGSGSMNGRPHRHRLALRRDPGEGQRAGRRDGLQQRRGVRAAQPPRLDAHARARDRIAAPRGGGTNFHAIFQRAKAALRSHCDPVRHAGLGRPRCADGNVRCLQAAHGADPRVFSFDLAGYGTLQFPERNVFCLAGFSDKALQTMRFLEEDKSALIREIEAIEL